jgi:hypothetical protein
VNNGRPSRYGAIIFAGIVLVVLAFVCLVALHFGEVQR